MKLSDEQKAVIHAPLQAMAVTACAGSVLALIEN